jgi:hypothetical protein
VTAADDAHRLLADHDLPPGLLPGGITSATLSGTAFEVHLARPVERVVEGDRVWYDTTVRGELTRGRIERLSGVKVKKLLWVPVTAIRADGADLVFAVGPLSERVPRGAFGG